MVSLVRLSQSLIPVRTVFSYSDLLPGDYELIEEHAVDDLKAVHNNIRYALKNGLSYIQLNFPFEEDGITGYDYSDVYAVELRKYPEFGNMYVSGVNWGSAGNGRIRFKQWPEKGYDVSAIQTEALEQAIRIRDRLYATGQLTSLMSEFDKAQVYYWWIVDTCEYDWPSFLGMRNGEPYAWLAYGPLMLNTGTCQGYTSAFNLFMRIEGVECYTYHPDYDHVWSVAILDGITYHIDTNWSDWRGIEPSEDWFGMTEEFATSRHV